MLFSRYQSPLIFTLSTLYILISIFSIGTSIYYLSFELFLAAIFLFLFFKKSGVFKDLPVGFYVMSLVVILISCVSSLTSPDSLVYNIHYIIYYIMAFSAYALLRSNNINIESVLSGVNQFYVVYLIVCIVMWLLEISLGTYELGGKYTLQVLSINKSILLGLDGSPASIDSFSALVFLLNLFFGTNRSRNLMLVISLFAVVLTLRMTPLVAMTMSILVYLTIKNRLAWFGLVAVSNVVFIILLCVSWVIMRDIETVQNQGYLYLYNATHARSAIWGQQINVMLENYSLSNYLLGGFNNELFDVGLYQLSGLELKSSTYNPHSSFLLLLFRNPFIFVLSYLTYLFLIIKYFERRRAAIAIFIFFSLTMNSTLLATGNPVFTLMMILLVLPSADKKQFSKYFISKDYDILNVSANR